MSGEEYPAGELRWFKMPPRIEVGDLVTITDGEDSVVCRVIEKGGGSIKLRAEQGASDDCDVVHDHG